MLIFIFQLIAGAFGNDYFLIKDVKSNKIASIRNKDFIMISNVISVEMGYSSAFKYQPNQLSINGMNLCRLKLDVLGKRIMVCHPEEANVNWELSELSVDKDLYQIKLVSDGNDCEMCLGFKETPEVEMSRLREVSCDNLEYNTVFFIRHIKDDEFSVLQDHMGSSSNRSLSKQPFLYSVGSSTQYI